MTELPRHVREALDGYLAERELGSGYFGTVYKVVKPDTGDALVAKYLDPVPVNWPAEAEAMRAAQPDLFVRAGADSDSAWLASRYTRGHTADKRSASEVLPVIDGVLEDLVRLHKSGWLHNDIKPDNIVVDESGQARLIDFGLASRQLDPEERARLANEYRALEIKLLRGTASLDEIRKQHSLKWRLGFGGPANPREDVSPQTDLYAVGSAAYTLLHSRQASECSPRKFDDHVPQHVREFVVKAMACDPKDRYQSAEEMLQDLRRGR